jgi:hypothetical protein
LDKFFNFDFEEKEGMEQPHAPCQQKRLAKAPQEAATGL